jgi:hypothetical protein
MPQSLEPLTIDVPQDVLDDLQTRPRATRFVAGLDNEDEFYGLSTAYVRLPSLRAVSDLAWRIGSCDGTTCLSLHPSRPAGMAVFSWRPGWRRASG